MAGRRPRVSAAVAHPATTRVVLERDLSPFDRLAPRGAATPAGAGAVRAGGLRRPGRAGPPPSAWRAELADRDPTATELDAALSPTWPGGSAAPRRPRRRPRPTATPPGPAATTASGVSPPARGGSCWSSERATSRHSTRMMIRFLSAGFSRAKSVSWPGRLGTASLNRTSSLDRSGSMTWSSARPTSSASTSETASPRRSARSTSSVATSSTPTCLNRARLMSAWSTWSTESGSGSSTTSCQARSCSSTAGSRSRSMIWSSSSTRLRAAEPGPHRFGLGLGLGSDSASDSARSSAAGSTSRPRRDGRLRLGPVPPRGRRSTAGCDLARLRRARRPALDRGAWPARAGTRGYDGGVDSVSALGATTREPGGRNRSTTGSAGSAASTGSTGSTGSGLRPARSERASPPRSSGPAGTTDAGAADGSAVPGGTGRDRRLERAGHLDGNEVGGDLQDLVGARSPARSDRTGGLAARRRRPRRRPRRGAPPHTITTAIGHPKDARETQLSWAFARLSAWGRRAGRPRSCRSLAPQF